MFWQHSKGLAVTLAWHEHSGHREQPILPDWFLYDMFVGAAVVKNHGQEPLSVGIVYSCMPVECVFCSGQLLCFLPPW